MNFARWHETSCFFWWRETNVLYIHCTMLKRHLLHQLFLHDLNFFCKKKLVINWIRKMCPTSEMGVFFEKIELANFWPKNYQKGLFICIGNQCVCFWLFQGYFYFLKISYLNFEACYLTKSKIVRQTIALFWPTLILYLHCMSKNINANVDS